MVFGVKLALSAVLLRVASRQHRDLGVTSPSSCPPSLPSVSPRVHLSS